MQTRRILRRQGLKDLTCLSLPTIYRMIKRLEFPAPIRLSTNAVGWDMEEVNAWIDARKASRSLGGAR
jgi:prophage regulatory protein